MAHSVLFHCTIDISRLICHLKVGLEIIVLKMPLFMEVEHKQYLLRFYMWLTLAL